MGDCTSLCHSLGGHAKRKIATSLLGKKNQVLFPLEGALQPRASLGRPPSRTSPHSECATCGALTNAGRVTSIYGALGLCPLPAISGKPDGLLSLTRRGVQSHSSGTGPMSAIHDGMNTVPSLGPQEPDVVRSEGTQGSPLLRVRCKCWPLTHRSLLFQNLVSGQPHKEEDKPEDRIGSQNWDTSRDHEVTAEDGGPARGRVGKCGFRPSCGSRVATGGVLFCVPWKSRMGYGSTRGTTFSSPWGRAPPFWKGFPSR